MLPLPFGVLLDDPRLATGAALLVDRTLVRRDRRCLIQFLTSGVINSLPTLFSIMHMTQVVNNYLTFYIIYIDYLYSILYSTYEYKGGVNMLKVESKLSEILGRRRMDIKELAERAGIAYGTAHSLYHDRTQRLDFATLAKVCEALDIEIGELLVLVEVDGVRK